MKKEPDFIKCGGLIPAVIQNATTGDVLMLGYMNDEAYRETIQTGEVVFYSRSRERLWKKGETSGNVLRVKTLSVDCDRDTILIQAFPSGPTCHEGSASCFVGAERREADILDELRETIRSRRSSPDENSYTSSLFKAGIDAIVQKVGEEAVEVVIEGKNCDRGRFLNESADLIFHLMVLWEARGVSLADVRQVLSERAVIGGMMGESVCPSET